MDFRTHRNALTLIRQVFDEKKSTISPISVCPQKAACRGPDAVNRPFPRQTPESQGLDADHLAGFLDALKGDDALDLHSLMILRNGVVVAEADFGAYDRRIWHVTHSACKSITGLAIGMLIDEGLLRLDDRIVKLFEKETTRINQLTHKNLTVRHLLTMTSGVIFNEAGAVTETDWVRCFLESAIIHEPGKHFMYNSMNTYMLSAIVRQVSGQGLMTYLQDRLWEPLGIEALSWETCPKGIEKGGWGLYIRLEDLAKVGQLVLQKGRWNDRQLISENWIKEATARQIGTPAALGDFDYGYQIWVGRTQNKFLFNGMFGQNVLGFPDAGLLIVSNAGNNELFQQGDYFRLIDQYFTGEPQPTAALPDHPAAWRRLLQAEMNMSRAGSHAAGRWYAELVPKIGPADRAALCAALHGQTYAFEDAEASAVGLLPLLTQVMQSNYTAGLISLGFEWDGNMLWLNVAEADACRRLPVGFDQPGATELSFNGESYSVAISGNFTLDDQEELVLSVRLSFLEIANTRYLKIYFRDQVILTRWSESPGKPYLVKALAAISGEVKVYPFIKALVVRADNDFIAYKIGRFLEPELAARLIREQ